MVLHVYACLYKLGGKIHNGTPNRRRINSSHIENNLRPLGMGQIGSGTFHKISNMLAQLPTLSQTKHVTKYNIFKLIITQSTIHENRNSI